MAGWGVRCMDRSLGGSNEKYVAVKYIPSAERLDGTCRSGQGWHLNEDRCTRGASLDGTELECCVYKRLSFM